MCGTWVPTCTNYENMTAFFYLSHFKWVKKSTNSITHDSQPCALHHSTEVRFASLLSGGFINAIVANPPERKLAKRTSVHSTAATACFYSVDDGKSKLWNIKM